jgi:hypothetical protein
MAAPPQTCGVHIVLGDRQRCARLQQRGVKTTLLPSEIALFLAPSFSIMAFSSRALAAQHRVGRNIGVGDFFDTWGWRVTLYTRFLLQLEMKALRVSIWYYLWINVRCGSKLLAWLGCGNGDFASSTNIREGILVCCCAIHFRGHRNNCAFQDRLLRQDTIQSKAKMAVVLATILLIYGRHLRLRD